jgi:Flp pilus assembly protein TadD
MKDAMKLDTARAEFELGKLNESLIVLDQILIEDEKNISALILKAEIFYKQQQWGDALNLLNRVLEIEKENQRALSLKQMLMGIVSFWHKDNYNP